MKYFSQKKKNTAGFTLVEMLITIALFTIIIAIAVGGFTNALRTQRQVSSLISAQSNVSLALEQMTREARTGYLFCHDVGSSVPTSTCGCVIGNSQFNPTAGGYPAPADPTEYYPSTSDLPTWTCDALTFYNSDGMPITYKVSSGALTRDDGTGAQSITGDTVDVKSLKFVLFGNLEGDNWTPRVTISVAITPSSTDPSTMNDVLNLQTTVSARTIDCTLTTPADC